MKIKKVEIKDYKAFYGLNEFKVEGKNLFIYGENGSGKSSFYYALKDFFQSSTESLIYDETENIFLTKAQKGKGFIEVTFNPDKDGTATDKKYTVKKTSKDTYVAGDTSIRDAIKLKSFLTYKHLLSIHHIKKEKEIDLFELLVKGVLKHFKSIAITGTKELGELWGDVEIAIEKETSQAFNITAKKKEVDEAIDKFNTAFKKLFDTNSIENIMKFAQPILDKFGHNIEIELNYTQAKPNAAYNAIERNHVRAKVKYLGKEIPKPHIFLNEARLSAIAISIYLGMVKRHVQGIPCKVLFLDDIFIGLDISNRLPLLEILNTDFSAYQVFITTYDKPWYEFVRTNYLNRNNKWKCFEIYGGRTKKGFTIPHDYFGHGILGNQFGAVGEENATLQHLDLYSLKALPAVIFQTRGQNSWVNFSGVNNEALRKIREGSKTNNKNLLEEGQKEFKFATPKDNILPKIFNFKTYETARRIHEQEEIRKSEAYLDPRGTYEDTYISELLSRLTSRNSGKLNGFSRRSLGVSKRLESYVVDVIAEYEGNQEVERLIKNVFPEFKGTQKIYEISNGEVYRELMIKALETNSCELLY